MTTQHDHAAEGWTLESPTGRFRRIDLNGHGQEKQHFLLSAAACTLSLIEIARMSDAEAYDAFKAISFAAKGGEPYCPECGPLTHAYTMNVKSKPTPIYKCAGCRKQFTATSGTSLSSRKMSFRDILCGIVVFANGASGVAALRLRREIKCSYKVAFVLEHKLREALANSREKRLLKGKVEVDGIALNAHQRLANLKKDRKNPTNKRFGDENTKIIVIARERGPGGESRMVVVSKNESHGAAAILQHIDRDAILYSDEGNWPGFGRNKRREVKHNDGYSINGNDINLVESANARIRRAARGVYYHIREKNLDLYGQEILWREDYRRLANGEQWRRIVAAATRQTKSRRFKGYWTRSRKQAMPRRRRRSTISPTKSPGFQSGTSGAIDHINGRPSPIT